jgi:DNA replication protein DnaC
MRREIYTEACFPGNRSRSGFDFSSSETETLVRELHRSDLIDDANNVAFVGGPGTAKTPFATAIGVRISSQSCRFYSTVELVKCPRADESTGTIQIDRQSPRPPDLVILDELGCLPFDPQPEQCSSIC